MTEAWSIRRRLPLLLVAVLVLVVGTLMAASYVEVRTQTLAAVEERLARIASQIGTVIDTSAVRVQLARLDALAGAPTTIDLLVGRDADSTSALALLRTASPGNVAHVGLWSTTGTLVLEATSGGLGAWARTAPPVGDSVAIGAMRAVDDTTVFYDIVAPVRLDGRVVGSLVVRRRVAPATNAGIQAVLGPSGRLLIGNGDGSLWMEGPSVVAPPPETVLRAGGLVRYERAGGEHYGVVGAMASTPWSLLFEVGHAEALAPATAYLERILIIAAALLALGVVAAWGLGRRLAAPLDTLARAVSKISAGDYGTRVALSAPVEAAQLSKCRVPSA